MSGRVWVWYRLCIQFSSTSLLLAPVEQGVALDERRSQPLPFRRYRLVFDGDNVHHRNVMVHAALDGATDEETSSGGAWSSHSVTSSEGARRYVAPLQHRQTPSVPGSGEPQSKASERSTVRPRAHRQENHRREVPLEPLQHARVLP